MKEERREGGREDDRVCARLLCASGYKDTTVLFLAAEAVLLSLIALSCLVLDSIMFFMQPAGMSGSESVLYKPPAQ